MNYLRDTEVVSSYVVTIEPEIANIMLGRNASNRRVNGKRVAQYAKTMKDGEWKLTGQPIIVSEDGHIIDGQHRLMAIAASGVTVKVLLVKIKPIDGKGDLTALNVPVDIGFPRNVSNITGLSPREVSIARTMVFYFENGGQTLSPRPEIIADRYDMLKEHISKYAKIQPTKRTTVGAMVGFVMADIVGFDCLDMVSNVALSKYENLAPIWGSYIRASDRTSGGTAHSRVVTSMALAWRIKDATGSILRVHNINKAIDEMKELYNSMLDKRTLEKEAKLL